MLSIGIDSGSTMTKGAVYDGKEIIITKKIPTSAYPKESMDTLYQELVSDEVVYTVATGYGRDLLQEANKKITEITCHGKGATFLCPNTRFIIDIGGQDCKAIALDRDENIVDFLMNDKCAAGTGRFVEVMMRTLGKDMEQLKFLVEEKEPVPISSMCTVFAESEIISLLAKGEEPEAIALGMIHSICKRTAMFARKLPIEGNVFFSGGLAQIPIFQKTLERYLQRSVQTHSYSQYAGAIGAAVIGWQKARREGKMQE